MSVVGADELAMSLIVTDGEPACTVSGGGHAAGASVMCACCVGPDSDGADVVAGVACMIGAGCDGSC